MLNTLPEAVLAPAVERAMRILMLLESAPQRRFPLNEIARALGAPKSSLLNICMVLVAGQLLRRTPDGGYQLGRRLVQLGAAYVSSVDPVREFYDACRGVALDLNAMVQLAVLDEGLNAVYLARQDCNSGLRLGLRAEIGRHVPASCTGCGKALLSALPAAELEARLQNVETLPTLTPRSISTPAALRKELERIRTRGHATDDEETVPGVACIATNARTSHREDGLVAISVTAAKDSWTPARRKLMLETLTRLVDVLETRL